MFLIWGFSLEPSGDFCIHGQQSFDPVQKGRAFDCAEDKLLSPGIKGWINFRQGPANDPRETTKFQRSHVQTSNSLRLTPT